MGGPVSSKFRIIFREEIVEKIKSGKTLIVDRYCYSGVAYSMSNGFSKEWCKMPDVGLPEPDLLFFMDIDPEQTKSRGNYGEEIYEKLDFQKKVYSNF